MPMHHNRYILSTFYQLVNHLVLIKWMLSHSAQTSTTGLHTSNTVFTKISCFIYKHFYTNPGKKFEDAFRLVLFLKKLNAVDISI